MTKTLTGLSKSLKLRLSTLDKKVSEVAKQVAFNVAVDLISVTPVDTSNALSNWQVSLNEPVSKEINPYFPGLFGSTESQSENAAFSAAKSILDQKKPGEVIFISNVVDYIVDLDRGSSRQEPSGFVYRAVALGRSQAKRIRIGF